MAGSVLVNFQNSFGASQVTSQQTVPVISESLTNNREQLVESNMYARFGESPYHEGAVGVEGTISFEPLPSTMGHFLKSCMGTVATTSGTGIQTHVFVPATPSSEFDCRAAVQPMTIEAFRDVGSANVYYDMLGNDFSLNMANGELLSMDVNFIGAGTSRKAASTPVYPTGKPFIWDQFSGSYNGQAITDLQDLTITYANNLEAFHTLTGSKSPYRIKRTSQQTIEISGTFVYASHSYQQAFEAQAENAMKFNFANADAPHTLLMEFSKVRFKTFEPQMGDAGLVTAGFTAQAIWDTSSDRATTFTLVNTHTYY